MSELKAYRVKGVTLGDTHDVYLKSEADKVISKLEQQIEFLQKEKKIIQDLYIGEIDDCRIWASRAIHNKYKRCLAMADKCESMCYCFAVRFDHHELVDNVKWELFDRWRLRWAKLADKFKEAK